MFTWHDGVGSKGKPRGAPVALAVVFLLLAAGLAPGAARAESGDEAPRSSSAVRAGDYVLMLDGSGQRLLVFQPRTGRLVHYQVNWGRAPEPVGVRDIASDFAAPLETFGKESVSAPKPVLPEADVPGGDPPGFPRLAGLVRASVSYERSGSRSEGPKEEWHVVYVTLRSPAELFEDLRSALEKAGVVLTEWSIDADSGQASFEGRRDDEEWSVGIWRRSSDPRQPRRVTVHLERSLP